MSAIRVYRCPECKAWIERPVSVHPKPCDVCDHGLVLEPYEAWSKERWDEYLREQGV